MVKLQKLAMKPVKPYITQKRLYQFEDDDRAEMRIFMPHEIRMKILDLAYEMGRSRNDLVLEAIIDYLNQFE